MKNYFFNNFDMIEWYKNLLDGGFTVNDLLDRFHDGSLTANTLKQHSLFRMFLDSCLMLYNKDRLDTELGRKFSFIDYLKKTNLSIENQMIIRIANKRINDDLSIDYDLNSNVKLFYSFDPNHNKVGAWEQAKCIRNCFAHAHFDNMRFTDAGNILYYDVKNIDDDKPENNKSGFAIEHFVHEWIKKFFSYNPNIGIPYKHVYFEFDENNSIYIVTISLSKQFDEKYDGASSHPLREISFHMNNRQELDKYIEAHKSDFIVEKQLLSDFIKRSQLITMIENYNLLPSDYKEGDPVIFYPSVHYAIKTIYSPQIEISNFLTALSLLNDTIMQAIINILLNKDNDKENGLIEKSLLELKEDESAILAFKIGFVLLKSWNIAYRMENKTFPAINLNNLDVSDVVCVKVKDGGSKASILDRFRNALMHGNIKLKMDSENGVIVVFEDEYKGNLQIIEMTLDDLEIFVKQLVFRDNIQ